MKKRILFFVAVAVFSTVVFISCKKDKDTSPAAAVKAAQLDRKEINKDGSSRVEAGALNIQFQPAELDNADLNNAFGCFPDLRERLAALSPDVLAGILEDYPWVRVYVIDLPMLIDDYHTSVLVGVQTETQTSDGIIRKWKGNTVDGKFTGEFWLTDLNNKTILHNQYVTGKRVAEEDNFEDWIENGAACKPRGWHCSRSQFNAAYQRAKAECEGDFVCDVACSFNPCCAAFLASAIIDCS